MKFDDDNPLEAQGIGDVSIEKKNDEHPLISYVL